MNGDFKTHLFTYRHEGVEWVLAIEATDASDARERLAKLVYATYDGVQVAQIPASLGPAVALATWVRNAVTTLMPRFFQPR